jgi:formate--tetrahydrofolate ligase
LDSQRRRAPPIGDVAAAAGIDPDGSCPSTRSRQIKLSILDRLAAKPDGKLIIVTAITLTKAGEGKTTTSIALTQGWEAPEESHAVSARAVDGPRLRRQGQRHRRRLVAVMPMEDINLHFNGDSHAVTAARSARRRARCLDFQRHPLGSIPLASPGRAPWT